ncbi:MAG: DNA double-strand break repair ATPase Rad50 [Haloferacaceae archaeon]
MRFDRVRLRNFRPYAEVDLELSDGVTVVHGVNGSGKSSLLEAAFFALYGSSALRTGVTLEEVLTKGEDETEVTLWFTHGGDAYRVERNLTRYDDRIGHDCVLETPETTVEGATDVEAFVGDLLRMDAEAFVNCAYVRQGEVNKLINATPAERQDMIDELLQLGTLEEYRERAGAARLGVGDVLAGKRELLEDKADRIAAIEEEDPHETLNALRSELAEVESEIERFEDNRAAAEETLAEAEAVLDEHEERRDDLAEVESEIDELEAAIRDDEDERESLRERVREHEERIEDLTERIETLAAAADVDPDPAAVADRREDIDAERREVGERIGALGEEVGRLESEADDLEAEAADLRERAAEKRERAAEFEERAADAAREAIADLEAADGVGADIDPDADDGAIEAALAAVRGRFDGAPVDPGEAASHRDAVADDLEAARAERNEVSENLRSARDRVAEAEALLDEGKCPECGQPVDGSPHVESLDEYRAEVADLEADLAAAEAAVERHEERLATAEALVAAEGLIDTLAARRETVETTRERAAEAREEADDLAAEAEAAAERAAGVREEAAEKRSELGDLNERKGEIDDAVDRLDDLAAALDERREAESEAERLRERRSDLAERNDERRERLERLREQRDDLRAAVDEDRIEEARADKQRAEEYLDRVAGKLDDLDERRGDLRARIGAVEERLDELDRLRAERDRLEERVEALESLHEEVERLEATYGDLRADLRRRNVETLERLLNETFDLVYANDAYARLRLDDDYGVSVLQKDGQTLAPDQLSGGERALFNLSLRCAVYRLLAEGIEGTAPMPPLILDEPTVFLDAGHVTRLVDLVEEMRRLGVAQTVIVSHDEELVAAADDLVTVEKDPTTNRSTAAREERPGPAAAGPGAGAN